MSEESRPQATPATATRGSSPRGQSFVEFALVLPLLLVLLLGIADFGRVFQAGITVEAATRSAAEAAAQEYLQTIRNGGTPDYAEIHRLVAESVCEELQHLPRSDYNGSACPTWPVIRSCVHDGVDTSCNAPVPGFAGSIPPACDRTDGDNAPSMVEDPIWTPAQHGGTETSIYLEVRACYLFETLFNLNLSLPMNAGLNLGNVYLEDRSVFTVADY